MNPFLRGRRRLLLPLVLGLGLVAAPSAASAQTTGCPSVGDDFGDSGPFSVTVDQDFAHTYYSPANLGSNGCTAHPVILWGNGTGASPSTYSGLLRHFASHGFIVAAANTANAGSGEEMIDGLDNLTDFNSQPGNRFFNLVDLSSVGTTGHSQGGGGAEAAAFDERVDTTFPLQPWLGDPSGIEGSAFFMAGEDDSLVSPSSVRRDFTQSSDIPAAYGELANASHFEPVGDGGDFRAAATAWARWQLMDDTIAEGYFVGSDCVLCTSNDWSEYEANSLLDSGGGDDPPSDEPPWWCWWCD